MSLLAAPASPGATAQPTPAAAALAPLADGPIARAPTMAALPARVRAPEPELLPPLLEQARLDAACGARVAALARRLAQGLRQRAPQRGREELVQALLQEYTLSSQEGVALMCLAEALLRIPDAATRDALIRDKIGRGDWRAHLGRSPSTFVNAATWGLLLTGRLTATPSEEGLGAALTGLLRKGGVPLIRRAVGVAMRLLGEQFVTGQTIEEALGRARVHEAIDFLHFDAAQISDAHWPCTARPLGPVACISPWNFPLAIFTGQIAAALAAGNPVLAKPAEQTPLVAARMTELLHAAGVPRAVLQLLPGPGETVGAALVADARIAGVVFTGSTEVARLLQQALAARPGPVVPVVVGAAEAAQPPAGLLTERSVSVNTAAAGGNATLMALD